MITYTCGNLLESEAEALVNIVNTVGVMGKGIDPYNFDRRLTQARVNDFMRTIGEDRW